MHGWRRHYSCGPKADPPQRGTGRRRRARRAAAGQRRGMQELWRRKLRPGLRAARVAAPAGARPEACPGLRAHPLFPPRYHISKLKADL